MMDGCSKDVLVPRVRARFGFILEPESAHELVGGRSSLELRARDFNVTRVDDDFFNSNISKNSSIVSEDGIDHVDTAESFRASCAASKGLLKTLHISESICRPRTSFRGEEAMYTATFARLERWARDRTVSSSGFKNALVERIVVCDEVVLTDELPKFAPRVVERNTVTHDQRIGDSTMATAPHQRTPSVTNQGLERTNLNIVDVA